MSNVGPSTGCLYKIKTTFDILDFYSSIGMDRIEFNLLPYPRLRDLDIDSAVEKLQNFDHVTVHAPAKKIVYGDNKETDIVIDRLQSLYDRVEIDGFVIHPNDVDDYTKLTESGLPFLIENMDLRKPEGTHPEHFRRYKEEVDFGFVFDVQHAYEHDHGMEVAREILDVMGDRLEHIHVAGCSADRRHYPTHIAPNREAITEILDLGIDVPKILECMIESDDEIDYLLGELEFVRSFEK